MKWGWGAIEAHVRKALVERKGIFAEYFDVEIAEFETSTGESLMSPFVYCADITRFVETLASIRGYNFTDMAQKIGMDSGKGHLRMVLTLYDEDDLLPANIKQRSVRAGGIGSGTNYRLTGRKKIMIVASAPGVPETYKNCALIIDKVKINTLLYTFTGDLKLYNIVGRRGVDVKQLQMSLHILRGIL